MTSRRRASAAMAVVVAAGAVVTIAASGSGDATATARTPAADTVAVERGTLSAKVAGTGVLTYRAQPDGSPYSVVNRAGGTYTELPENGDQVRCGGVLYRVDDRPVVLLCGTVPAYRTLHVGMRGADVRQLNRALHVRAGRAFTPRTEQALKALQRRKGIHANGVLTLGAAVFLPEAVRIAKVAGEVGGTAGPGAPVLRATSDTLHVQVDLDPSQQRDVKRGDRAQITLPGSTAIAGKVVGFGRVAQTADQGGPPAAATVPTFLSLDDASAASGLDRAPVQVDIATRGVKDALSVPVTALVGAAGGGFAVEVARAGGQRELVAVAVGLFDTGGGRVQVEGRLREHDLVVVPSI